MSTIYQPRDSLLVRVGLLASVLACKKQGRAQAGLKLVILPQPPNAEITGMRHNIWSKTQTSQVGICPGKEEMSFHNSSLQIERTWE